MAPWLRLLLGGGTIDGKRLVSESGFLELVTNHVKTQGGYYGLGLFIEEWHGHRLYFHAGGVTGFGSRVELLPGQKLGLAVLTNFDDQMLPKKIRELVYANLVARP
jgi:CubicO group peptidase (beta-lactamase class C family)